MESTIPEGAPTNYFQPYLQDYADVDRDYWPSEYQKFGAYSWIEVPE